MPRVSRVLTFGRAYGIRMVYYGVDVSYAQGNYHPGSESVVIINSSRANTGSLVTGSYYRTQVTNARAAGKQLGHYFFNGTAGGKATATQCANYFVNNLYDFRSTDILILDVEAEPGTGTAAWTPAKVLEFAKRVYALTGVKIGVYLNKSLMTGMDWSQVVAYGCYLWIAYYNQTPPGISYWPTWIIWQWTSAGIDKNELKLLPSQIRTSFAGGGAVPITDPTNPIPLEESMSYSIVKDAKSATQWVVSLNTGLKAGISSTYHTELLQRVKDNKGADPMLAGEVDIVRAYLAAINPVTPVAPVTGAPDIDYDLLAAKVAALVPAASAAPTQFAITLEGKAQA